MGKVTIRIPNVTWRDGRPRFIPSAAQRALGFKGQDLRHGPAGAWFSLDEAIAWSADFDARLAAARTKAAAVSQAAARREVRKAMAANVYAIGNLIGDLFATPRYQGIVEIKGKRQRQPLAKNTRDFYRHRANTLQAWDDGALWATPIAGFDKAAAYQLSEALTEEHGLAVARACMALLSAAFSWGERTGKVTSHPFRRLGMETPPPRLRTGTIEEMLALIAAADAAGRPDVGDMIALGLFTGQRQADRILLIDGRMVAGRLVFRQKKTGAIVAVPPTPMLTARLEAARARRTTRHDEVSIDERTGLAWTRKRYSTAFAEVRAKAAGEHPSLADFRDQDLRDTAVTWLGMAGATIPEIVSITGHSLASATQILKHYLAARPEMADAGIAKLVAWMGGNGS